MSRQSKDPYERRGPNAGGEGEWFGLLYGELILGYNELTSPWGSLTSAFGIIAKCAD